MCCLFVDGLDSTLVDLTDATTIVDRPLSSTVGPEISLDVESREFGRFVRLVHGENKGWSLGYIDAKSRDLASKLQLPWACLRESYIF